MKATGLPKKFLSRREKNGHKRQKSSDPPHKHRPLSSDAFFSMFKPESARQAAKGEAEQEKETIKIDDVKRILAERDIAEVAPEHIQYALNTKYADGNPERAVEALLLYQQSMAGKIVHYNPNINMVGAENRGNVTCYLDALLFAMFAKLEAFECMLKNELPEEAPQKLAALLRLWVNMLRTGKLIQTDLVQLIQEALAAAGWAEAQRLEQQDTSEAFAFITETLQLPLLTLQVDLFHHGKNDESDHKVVYERLLNLAVPADPEGKGIKLEDCLEDYFNTQVDVLRDSLDEKQERQASMASRSQTPKAAELLAPPEPSQAPDTSSTLEPPAPSDASSMATYTMSPTAITSGPAAFPEGQKSTIRLVTNDDERESTSSEADEPPHMAPLERRWTSVAPESEASGSTLQSPVRPHRSRTESIIQRVVLDDQGKPTDSDAASLFQRAKRKVSVVKAVTIPAWQFFKLIPWHQPANKEPQNDLEVARHFSQRPVVGICLKRYMVDEHGNMKRQNTYIDIPDSLRLPQFIVDERVVEENGLSAEYKLVLQSVVCHRGDSLHSGHYISFARVAPKLLTDNRRHEDDPPPDYEEAQWVKFDDLAIEERVKPVDDIKQSLKEEMPYLLFYQIVPIVDVTASSADGKEVVLPSYDDSTVNVTISDASDPPGPNSEPGVMSRSTSSYFDNTSALHSANASIRFSSELERPTRQSIGEDDGFLNVSRRGSLGDLIGASSVATTADPSPTGTPAVTPGEENTAQRLSRAASKFRSGNKSRPQSQVGEGRLSITMSRLSGLVKSSKEPLRDPSLGDEEDFEIISAASHAALVKETEKEVEKKDASPLHKRGKSKTRLDKGKAKESKAKSDVPDRECIVQ